MWNTVSMDCTPNTNITNPPINSITLEYLMATFVPYVPMVNHRTTAIKLKILKIIGSTHATAPWQANTKFSMFPNINKPKNCL